MTGIDYTVDACERCPDLVANRSRIVNGVGSGRAGIVFVGEAPGADEDERGEPFVGRSGEILTEKLADRDLARDDVRITNTVRCRPPENRDPYVGERANCHDYLAAELATYDPAVVCSLGRIPTHELLGRSPTLGDVVGERFTDVLAETVGVDAVLVPCYHPAAMLYDRSREDDIDRVLDDVVALAGAGGDG